MDIVFSTRKVIALGIKMLPVSKKLRHVSEFNFMQITGYSLEVNGLKDRKERLTVTYVPSAAIVMILTFQCPL